MKINSIKIVNLFEIFTYDISFKTDEKVLIITGPNGFGKTMILNIIFNLFNRKFSFFQKLVFDIITVSLDENIKIIITKTIEKSKPKISFSFFKNDEKIEKIDYFDKQKNEFSYLNNLKINKDLIDITLDDWSDDIFGVSPMEMNLAIKTPRVNEILDSIQVHLIREQRLLKKIQSTDKKYISFRKSEKEQTVMTETIEIYSKELQQLILNFTQKSFIKTQELDSSYPKRLVSENNILTQKEYEEKYNILKKKQEKLTEFELYEFKQELITYNNADAKALSVYLNDLELKLGVFDKLLEKLELFTSILNERRFTFKSIKISRTKGFYFKTSKGKELELSQ